MIEQPIHPYPYPRDATMAPQIREECQDMPQRKGAYLRGESTHPWRRQCPRDEDIPRMKGVYPRRTMRTRRWQEDRCNHEEANESNHSCPINRERTNPEEGRELNREVNVEWPKPSSSNREYERYRKTNALIPLELRTDISTMQPRIDHRIDSNIDRGRPWSTVVDHGRPMVGPWSTNVNHGDL